jgi:hypothetical protein
MLAAPRAQEQPRLGASRAINADRVAHWLATAACIWFALAAAWGMFGLLGAGHTGGGMAGTAMMSENILRWKTPYPLWEWYTTTQPSAANQYCHHPFGMYWLSAFCLAIFGHHDFVVPLPAVLMSAATPPLLYGTAKARWGTVAGAAAACGFAVVPIDLGFANFHNLEVMCIFGVALFFWGHAHYQVTKKRRHLVASLAGVAFAASADWIGYLPIGVVLGWGLVRAFLLPKRMFPLFDYARYTRWWALCASLSVLFLLLWVGLFYEADKIGDWLSSAEMRGGHEATPLSAVLEARKNWIAFSFTPLAIAIGKVALPIALLRILAFRRDEEVFAIAILAAAVGQYLGFKRGADVHIYWPHYFGAYFALALALLVATIGGVTRWVLARVRVVRAKDIGTTVALALTLVPVVMMTPDAVRSVQIWRATGGKYDDNGAPIRSSIDTIWVVEKVMRPRMPEGASVDYHPAIAWGWEHIWASRASSHSSNGPSPGSGDPFFIARASALSPDDQKRIAGAGHVRAYGDIWLVDQREAAAPIDAVGVEEREPNPLEWFFLGGVEPVRTVVADVDPFLTWEWRTHLGLDATAPAAEPRTLDELRIAHNVAIARGDASGAELLRERIESQIDRTVSVRFDQGMRIIGVRTTHGVRPQLEVWFEAAGPTQGDAVFAIHSMVDRAEPLSLVPPSTAEREMAYATSLPPKVWKRGNLYVVRCALLHRIGFERYFGAWRSRDGSPAPGRLDAKPSTDLVTVR